MSALARIGPAAQDAVPKLRKMMESDEDAHAAAAFAVFRILGEDRRALDVLMAIARNPQRQPAVAVQAARFISELGPKARRALPVMIWCCSYKSKEQLGFDGLLRRYAFMAVATVGGADSLPTLKKGLASVDALDRQAAAEAISTIGPPAAGAVPELIRAIRDERSASSSLFARLSAARALGDIGYGAKAAIPALRQMADAEYKR